MKHYYITGGSRGIGEALINEILKDKNNKVWNYSRTPSKHPDCTNVLTDLSSADQLVDIKFPEAQHAEEIILINNAGLIGEIAPTGEKDAQKIVNTFNVNTIAPSILSNQFAKQFQNAKASKFILNISSGAGRKSVASWAEYCASKAALDMQSLVLADEQKKQKYPIRIVSIAPGVIDTKMQDEIRSTDASKFDNLAYFVELKENKLLDQPEYTAKKILDNFKKIFISKEVLQDLRQI